MPNPVLIDDGPALQRAGLIHRAQAPEGAGPHPTVVMLHGRAGDEDVMWIFARALPKAWLLVAPRGLVVDTEEGGYSWHPPQPGWPSLDDFDAAVTAVTHFVNALPDLYDADPAQIYLMGFSQGAALAYATALRQPGLVQGIAGLVGFAPEMQLAEGERPLAGLPIFQAVGLEDESVPLVLARHSADALRRAGAELAYHEYETGHKLNREGMRDLKTWWSRRQPAS